MALSGPEKKFTEWLKRSRTDMDIQRIETITGQGIPDCSIAIRGRDGSIWVELKALKKVKLRSEQYAWGMKRTKLFNDRVYLWNGFDKIIQIWKFPFLAEPAGKGHVRPVPSPYIECSYEYFKENLNLTKL